MKNIENMKALDEIEMAKVAGGDITSPVGSELGQKKDIVTDPGNNLYPPLGRPLPFPQDRRGN